MKVYILGDDGRRFVEKTVTKLGHTVVNSHHKGDITSESGCIALTSESDLMVCFEPSKYKHGILELVAAKGMVPVVFYILEEKYERGVSPNLEMLTDKFIVLENKRQLKKNLKNELNLIEIQKEGQRLSRERS